MTRVGAYSLRVSGCGIQTNIASNCPRRARMSRLTNDGPGAMKRAVRSIALRVASRATRIQDTFPVKNSG